MSEDDRPQAPQPGYVVNPTNLDRTVTREAAPVVTAPPPPPPEVVPGQVAKPGVKVTGPSEQPPEPPVEPPVVKKMPGPTLVKKSTHRSGDHKPTAKTQQRAKQTKKPARHY